MQLSDVYDAMVTFSISLLKLFLFGKASNDVDYLLEGLDVGRIPTEIELQKWRKLGPLGKLHNIVVHISGTLLDWPTVKGR